MYVFITVMIVLVCLLLILVVLVQNPKGGGLSASFGGLGNQVMGARRATDFLEKSTWTLAIVLLVFSLLGSFFMPKTMVVQSEESEIQQQIDNVIPSQSFDSGLFGSPDDND